MSDHPQEEAPDEDKAEEECRGDQRHLPCEREMGKRRGVFRMQMARRVGCGRAPAGLIDSGAVNGVARLAAEFRRQRPAQHQRQEEAHLRK
jgi:hypothetical protein